MPENGQSLSFSLSRQKELASFPFQIGAGSGELGSERWELEQTDFYGTNARTQTAANSIRIGLRDVAKF